MGKLKIYDTEELLNILNNKIKLEEVIKNYSGIIIEGDVLINKLMIKGHFLGSIFKSINESSKDTFIIVFNESLLFKKKFFEKDLIFKKCIFEKDLIFDNCEFEGKLEIKDCIIKGKLEIKKIKVLKKLDVICNNNLKNNYNIKRLYISNFDTLSSDDTHYFLYNIRSEQFFLDSFSNISDKFVFGNCEVEELYLKNAFLGNMIFNTFKINELYLKNSTLNNCIFNGVEFKNYTLLDSYIKDDENKGKLFNRQLKDNYRQLKFVMDKNGNYTEGNRFFEKEMEYYGKELKENGCLQERFILWIQKEISFFGKNWFKVVLLIIILALITDIINYCYISNSFKGGIYEPKDFWKLFFNLLYPLFGLGDDLIKKFNIPLTIGFMLYKITYGILLWHLGIALKRTTKR